MRNRVLIALAVSILAASPGVMAWGAKGDNEPSTSLDRNGGWMYNTSDTTPTNANPPIRKVYFNAFGGAYLGYVVGVSTMINPNFAQLGSGVETYPYRAFAMLGIWKDCNRDGFVGLGDNALFEYRVELLPDTTVCKPGTMPTPIPRQNYLIPHNDGQWIHEWIPIGWDYNQAALDFNPMNINDSSARVWGDYGKPGDAPGQPTCFVSPHPRGTYHSVGGVTNYVDCFATGRIRAAVTSAGLGPQYAAAQAIRNPWGEESDAAMVEPWDCSQPQTHVSVFAPPELGGNEQNVTNVSRPRIPPTTNPSGSPAGTANATGSGFDECERTAVNDGNTHRGQGLATIPYATEGDVGNQPAQRFQTDQELAFSEGQRPNAPFQVLGRLAPQDGGLGNGVDHTQTPRMNFWVGNSVTAASRNPFVNRESGTPMPVSYLTYYAYVGSGAVSRHGLSLPKGGTSGVYGSEACTGGIGPGKGIQNEWLCDPTKWWLDAGGNNIAPTVDLSDTQDAEWVARVGSPYSLRDVDCLDYSTTALRAAGIGKGILTSTSCS